jgi:hypothetical protein
VWQAVCSAATLVLQLLTAAPSVCLLGALHPSEYFVFAYAVNMSGTRSLVGAVSAGSSEDVLCKEACCCPRVRVAAKHNVSITKPQRFCLFIVICVRCIRRWMPQRVASSSSVARQPDYEVYLISNESVGPNKLSNA